MSIFSPLVTLLMFVIICRGYYELDLEKKKNEKLTEYLFGEEVNEEVEMNDIPDEIKNRDAEFDARIDMLREELEGTHIAYLDLIEPTSVADVLDENVYNLSRDEIVLLDEQMRLGYVEYSD